MAFSPICREQTWIERFCNHPDNYYMCEVDEEYIRDSFNLYGLESGCALYKPAINLILDGESSSDDSSSGIDGEWIFIP